MISFVIPVFNEAGAVRDCIARIHRALEEGGMEGAEVVVVDDGSTDDSAAILASTPGVRLVQHPHNAGYGRALKTGIEAARHELIAIVDADGTYPVEDLPRLLEAFEQGFDMVVGARRGIEKLDSPWVAPLRGLLRWMVEFTTGRRIPDVNSGFRIFRRSTVLGYFPHLCDTFSFTTSMTLSYMMTGRFVHYVPIEYHEREGQSKVRLFRDSLRTLQYIAQAIVYYNPLKMFLILSMGVASIAPLCGLLWLLLGGEVWLLAGAGTVLLALLVVCLGFLGVLLKQIMDK
ncbi:MAG: glycosyltransferase family 2 protein [Myxococcota bacterium]|nr:glycosyltransferase family 2 protein [Myxococcota bacterium]